MRRVWLTAVAWAILAASAQAVPVDLYLEPATSSGVKAGDIVRLDLIARSVPVGQTVTGVQALIQYDTSVLQLVDESANPTTEIYPRTSAPAPWQYVVMNQTFTDDEITGGGIYYAAGVVGTSLSTDFSVAWMYMRALVDFDMTEVALLPGPITHDPWQLESKVADGPGNITGALHGAELFGAEVIADAGGPYAIPLGGSVVFDATGTQDPGGDVANYLWEVLGQVAYDGPLATAPLTWDDLVALGVTGYGVYDVLLTVRDSNLGTLGTDRTTLAVTDAAVPEPVTLGLLAAGLGAIGVRRRRSKA